MDNVTNAKPLWCPFCGSESLDDTCTGSDSKGTFYFVFCDTCDTEGPPARSKAEAIEKWNERHDEPREPNGGYSPYDEWRTGADV